MMFRTQKIFHAVACRSYDASVNAHVAATQVCSAETHIGTCPCTSKSNQTKDPAAEHLVFIIYCCKSGHRLTVHRLRFPKPEVRKQNVLRLCLPSCTRMNYIASPTNVSPESVY